MIHYISEIIFAQELKNVLAKHGLDKSGMVHQHKDPNQYMSVRYNDLLAPMIKAIQELSEQNQGLSQENQQLKSILSQLQDDMTMIKSKLWPMVQNTSEE